MGDRLDLFQGGTFYLNYRIRNDFLYSTGSKHHIRRKTVLEIIESITISMNNCGLKMPLKEIKEMITSLNPIIAYSKTHVWLQSGHIIRYSEIGSISMTIVNTYPKTLRDNMSKYGAQGQAGLFPWP